MSRVKMAAWGVTLLVATAVVASVVPITPRAEEEQETPVSFEQLPRAVQVTVQGQAGGHEILEIEEVRIRQGTYYEAEWLDGGMEVEILVAPDGALLCRSLEEPDGPEDDEDEDEDDGDDGDDGDDD